MYMYILEQKHQWFQRHDYVYYNCISICLTRYHHNMVPVPSKSCKYSLTSTSTSSRSSGSRSCSGVTIAEFVLAPLRTLSSLLNVPFRLLCSYLRNFVSEQLRSCFPRLFCVSSWKDLLVQCSQSRPFSTLRIILEQHSQIVLLSLFAGERGLHGGM